MTVTPILALRCVVVGNILGPGKLPPLRSFSWPPCLKNISSGCEWKPHRPVPGDFLPFSERICQGRKQHNIHICDLPPSASSWLVHLPHRRAGQTAQSSEQESIHTSQKLGWSSLQNYKFHSERISAFWQMQDLWNPSSAFGTLVLLHFWEKTKLSIFKLLV